MFSGRIIRITDDVIDYREWIRENFEHLVITRLSPTAITTVAPGTKYVPLQIMQPAVVTTGQQLQMYQQQQQMYHQQHQAHQSALRHRRGSTSSNDDSEDSKECDADSTSPGVMGGLVGSMGGGNSNIMTTSNSSSSSLNMHNITHT